MLTFLQWQVMMLLRQVHLIKSVAGAVGGKGGGRPNMAQAGGKDAAGIDACIDLAKSIAKEQLG